MAAPHVASFEICILAGGLSSRMGRPKALVRIHGKTMLRRVFETASALETRVTIIRRDLVPRCGPLGGILTGLLRAQSDSVLFLACDMPLVPGDWLEQLRNEHAKNFDAVFTEISGRAGFPAILSVRSLPIIQQLVTNSILSIQQLATALKAQCCQPDKTSSSLFLNVNRPEDVDIAEGLIASPRSERC